MSNLDTLFKALDKARVRILDTNLGPDNTNMHTSHTHMLTHINTYLHRIDMITLNT